MSWWGSHEVKYLFYVFQNPPKCVAILGGLGSRRSLAVPRQSLVVPWQSLAAPRLCHGRVTPPYCSHLCSLPFCFMDAFQKHIPFVGVGWGNHNNHSWSCNFLRIFTTDIANPLTQTEPVPRQDLITGRGQSFLAVTAKNGHPEAKQRMVLEAQGIYFYYYNNLGNVWERKKFVPIPGLTLKMVCWRLNTCLKDQLISKFYVQLGFDPLDLVWFVLFWGFVQFVWTSELLNAAQRNFLPLGGNFS